MNSGFRWFYVPLIFLIFWIAVPLIVYFAAVKPMNEEWDGSLDSRNSARQAYSGDTSYTGEWPDSPGDVKPAFYVIGPDRYGDGAGQQDIEDQEQAFQGTMDDLEVLKLETEARYAAAERDYEVVWRRYMRDIDLNRFDYEKPDEFILELLDLQRDEEGPRLIQFLDRTYPDIYFQFDPALPPPPLTPASLPALGQFGSLAWPVGRGAYQMAIYGPYEELLEFVETFPDRYDRIAKIDDFAMRRVAFDYEGSVLMELTCTVSLYVFPQGGGFGEAAGGGGATGGFGGGPAAGGAGQAPFAIGGPGSPGPPPGGGAGPEDEDPEEG